MSEAHKDEGASLRDNSLAPLAVCGKMNPQALDQNRNPAESTAGSESAKCDLTRVCQFLKHALRITIVTHERPDADALGSSLGLAHALRKMDKQVSVISFDAVPRRLRFLPGIEMVGPGAIDREIDLVVALDAGEPAQIGTRLYAEIAENEIPVVVVDHHDSNARYGIANVILPWKASTAEVVLQIIQELSVPLDEMIATCLLAGIVFDSRGFIVPDTEPETLEAAASLMRCGGSLSQVMEHYRGQHALKALWLWGEALTHLQTRDGIAWTIISSEMYAATGTTMEDTEGLANLILDAVDVRISLVFRERLDGGPIRVSGRARPGINLLPLAQSYPKGGGHKAAVGFEVPPSLERAAESVVTRLQELWKAGHLNDSP